MLYGTCKLITDYMSAGFEYQQVRKVISTCRFLNHEFFTYISTYKILLMGNHKPKVRDNGHGIWRRLHLLPFDVTIPEEERDADLQDKLLKELPGILAWAV